MNETMQLWVQQAETIPGVLACGIRRADQSMLARSSHEQCPVPQIERLLQEIAEITKSLQTHRIAAGRLRWTFENARLYCATRADGAVAALVVATQIEGSPELEQLLAEFQNA
jgi:hypothetical protein